LHFVHISQGGKKPDLHLQIGSFHYSLFPHLYPDVPKPTRWNENIWSSLSNVLFSREQCDYLVWGEELSLSSTNRYNPPLWSLFITSTYLFKVKWYFLSKKAPILVGVHSSFLEMVKASFVRLGEEFLSYLFNEYCLNTLG
jgi:hypothetical protein